MADKRAAQQAEIDAAQKEAQVKAPVSSLLVGKRQMSASRPRLRWLDRRSVPRGDFAR